MQDTDSNEPVNLFEDVCTGMVYGNMDVLSLGPDDRLTAYQSLRFLVAYAFPTLVLNQTHGVIYIHHRHKHGD